MYSEIFGFRVNLIHLAIAVASYDLVHIVWELKERGNMIYDYEYTEDGCISNLFQVHCMAIYSDLGIYVVDFVFTCYLIYGAAKVGLTFFNRIRKPKTIGEQFSVETLSGAVLGRIVVVPPYRLHSDVHTFLRSQLCIERRPLLFVVRHS